MAALREQWTTADEPDTAVLYGIIDELRRAYPTPSAAKTLDLVVRELGRTQENLRGALTRLEGQPIPVGGKRVLNELEARAWQAGVDDIRVPLAPEERRLQLEPLDGGDVGIAVILGASALITALGLLEAILHSVR